MFDTVLVANRGEIACRVLRTLRRLAIGAVAVFSDADSSARHVRESDHALRIGPESPRESYLNVDAIIDAALRAGADAVHPGYGFLSENASFAQACADAGVVFIGPSPAAIDLMGDKIRAKRTVAAAGVPVVAGRADPGMRDEDLIAAALETGLPVLLKPSAGGGGKGMRIVTEADRLPEEIAGARREALGAFGDDTLFVEAYIERPRHVEIQVLADGRGSVVHLGERECSLQRRHQKIIEETPSPGIDGARRTAMAASALEVARACGYVGAGTVEFITPGDGGDHFFLEMNTRLQVEHPVTEMVTGLDLVEWQLRIASGEPLAFTQQEVCPQGHAVEARLYAEDPAFGFLPTGGRVLALREPAGPDVRVDSSLERGLVVSSTYDPMLAKVVAWGPDRESALRRLSSALAQTSVLGIVTNVEFLRALLAYPDVVAGNLDTGLVERALTDLVGPGPPDHVFAAAAMFLACDLESRAGPGDAWGRGDGWRLGEDAWSRWRFGVPEGVVEVRRRGTPRLGEVALGRGDPVTVSARLGRRFDGGVELGVELDGWHRSYLVAQTAAEMWLSSEGGTWRLRRVGPTDHLKPVASVAGLGPIGSPMPGIVRAVPVEVGQRIERGAPLVVVEAMKMEHTIAAPVDAVVSEVRTETGAQVRLDQTLLVLAEVEPS